MSPDEYNRWRASERVNPLPDPYWIGAQICQVIANSNRGPGQRSYQVDDFLPQALRKRSLRKQTVAEDRAAMRRTASASKGDSRSL